MAAQKGWKVRITTAADLIITLEAAQRQRRIKAVMHRIVAAPKLLIIDDEESMRLLLREYKPRLLQVEYTQLAQYGGQILVEHDVTWDLYGQIYQREPTTSNWWNFWRWDRCERRALAQAETVVAMSEKDAALTRNPRATVIATDQSAAARLLDGR